MLVAEVVRVVETAKERGRDVESELHGHRFAAFVGAVENIAEVAAMHELHGDVVVVDAAGVEDADDVLASSAAMIFNFIGEPTDELITVRSPRMVLMTQCSRTCSRTKPRPPARDCAPGCTGQRPREGALRTKVGTF